MLFPYPHAHTVEPMAKGQLSKILQDLGFSVITFDVPGAYRSTREPNGTIEEMLECTRAYLVELNYRWRVIIGSNLCLGMAPTILSTSLPFLNTSSVGMLMIPYFMAVF